MIQGRTKEMSYVLSIYSKKAFKECLLPAINNADYSLVIQKELFELSEDFELSMEIMDGKWNFQDFEEGSLFYTATKKDYTGEILKDKDVLSVVSKSGEKISIIIKETDCSFAVYEKFSLSNINEITIGKGEHNIFCYDMLSLVSTDHASIKKQGNGFIVEDASSNGVFVNARRIQGSQQLKYGDCIDIFGLRIVYLEQFVAVNTIAEGLRVKTSKLLNFEPFFGEQVKSKEKRKEEKKLFHRSPRNIPKIEREKIEIEAPPAPKGLKNQSLFFTVGPTVTMMFPMLAGTLLSIYSSKMTGRSSGAFMYTGLVTAIGSAVIGASWTLANMQRAKKTNREEELKRFEAYSEYLIKCTNEIKAKYENNMVAMKQLYPDAEQCCKYNIHSLELWNRNVRHEDFLCQRLGQGDLPFQVNIEIPKAKFTMNNDSMAEKPRMIKESYKYLHNVPICIDLLTHRLVGLIGGENRKGCYPLMYNLVAQIAANNCYTDIKMVFIYDEDIDAPAWSFAKWLPHVWTEDKKTRLVAGSKNEASEVLYEITKVLRMRAEEKNEFVSQKKQIAKPYYILFLENPSLLEGELISKYIYDTENDYGITTVMMVNNYEELPNACEYIVENTTEYQGMYGVADGVDERIGIQFDILSALQLEKFSRRLSSVEVNEVETGGEIPNVLTFFDMYGIQHLEELEVVERWKKNRTYESMKALVGQKAGGADCYLDVHEKYHGPHGLVAGTTGSGKSETLQTYMLSLAINYSPDDIGFFIIDYKGGGMANLFDGLPHIIGQISNLSGNQVHRAMVSIKSENLRRQRIFNEHGVNNINLYTRLYKNNEASIPVPHLFIIIDEFAELKREEPDFMKELISVAQVGRSLGVHLVLATQKPSGTVDDNIWSNSKFRLCLRVQDRQDSTDMLHKPDAAYITQAGRCYLQVGNDELYELFQSAWSGAAYDEEAGSVQTDIAKMLAENGKAALVGSYAKIKQKEKTKINWISQILDILNQAAEEVQCSITECLYDSTQEKLLVKAFFKKIKEKGVEYAESDYNAQRVQDVISICGEILNENVFYEKETKEIAVELIARAAERRCKLPEMKQKTQLDAVVEYLGKVAANNGYVNNLQLWLPVLPEVMYLNDLNGYEKYCFADGLWKKKRKGFSLETMVGLYDDPVNQAQRPLTVDIAVNGNHAIIGTVVSGKSTFLMTYLYSLVNRYAPDAVNLYILDYSSKMLGALEGLAHVGGVMFENDEEKVSKFFTMMEGILAERKRMLKGGSYSQYIQANGLKIPVILVAIDNMAAFRSKSNNMYDDLLMNLVKEGVGYGIYFVVTAAGFGMNEISNRMGENFRSVICLEMNDKYAYSEALRMMHLDVLPEQNVKGRGLAKVGDSVLEFQTALCMEAEDDYKRGERIKQRCQEMNAAWNGKWAKPIPEIPEKPIWQEFSKLEDVINMAAEGIRLPIGYDKKNAMVYGIDLRRTYCYMISGKARTGKTNTLRLAIMSAAMMGGEIAVVDFAGDLKAIAETVGAEYIDTNKRLFDFFMKISPDFKARNIVKKESAAAGMTSEEIFDKMQQFRKLFIFIGELPEFVYRVHNPGEGVSPMAPFLSTLLDKGAMHNVFWFAGFNQDETSKAIGLNVYNLFIKEKNGMHLGGNVSAQRTMNFDYIPYKEQNKSLKPGIAVLPECEDESTRRVVLPLYRME